MGYDDSEVSARRRNMIKIQSSEITPEQVYLNRRQFMKGVGAAALGAAVLAACSPAISKPAGSAPTSGSTPTGPASTINPTPSKSSAQTDELGSALTPYEAITNYNNYYEFSMDKEGIGQLAANFPVSPWSVQVGGMVKNPKTYALEDLLKK